MAAKKRWTVLIGAAAMVLTFAPAAGAGGPDGARPAAGERADHGVTRCPCALESAPRPVVRVRKPGGHLRIQRIKTGHIPNSHCGGVPGSGDACFSGGPGCDWEIIDHEWYC